MSKVATAGIVLLFGTGCATARPPLHAMLLPPVDGKLALWINQPAYFAVLGVGPERGTEVLYQQTALDAIPASGYVYVPVRAPAVAASELIQPDADYEQVYLVASDKPIDLTALPSAHRDLDPSPTPNFHAATMRSVLASSRVVDAYRFGTDTIDRTVCLRHQLRIWSQEYYTEPDPMGRVYRVHEFPCPEYRRSATYAMANRTFFTPQPKLHAPGKIEPSPPTRWVPPRLPPGLEPRSIERAARSLAAKDEYHALTHNGEPGTELARAGYVQISSGWSRSSASIEYAPRSSTGTSYRSSWEPTRAVSTVSRSSPSVSSASASFSSSTSTSTSTSASRPH